MENQSIDANFTFRGFSPKSDLVSYCKQIYCRVEDRSPSESSKVAFLIKTKDGYEGVIRVVSASGTFVVTSENRNPDHLVDDLYLQFSQKILSWSRSRDFSRQPIL